MKNTDFEIKTVVTQHPQRERGESEIKGSLELAHVWWAFA